MVYRKFHNHVTTKFDQWSGKVVTFHSDKEMARWEELNLLQLSGQVKDLERQTPYKFYYYDPEIYQEVLVRKKLVQKKIKPKLICSYYADFTYHEWQKDHWEFVVEDSKGQKKRIAPYPLKKQMMKIWYDIIIKET